jgi:uncharacterized RDD family membrane protein YckC
METIYKIIGGDGREYGPVTLDELKAWIRDGRVGRQTHVWRNDMGSWLAASQYQELQSELALLKGPATGVEGVFEPVGFWPRAAALIVDSLLIYAAFWLLWIPLANAMGWPSEFKMPATAGGQTLNDFMPMLLLGAKQTALSFSLRLIYEVLMNGKYGATLGKLIIGAKIVRLDGSALGYKFAFFRFLARIVSDLTCYIGYLIVFFREDKRALHDLIAGTRVIYKR